MTQGHATRSRRDSTTASFTGTLVEAMATEHGWSNPACIMALVSRKVRWLLHCPPGLHRSNSCFHSVVLLFSVLSLVDFPKGQMYPKCGGHLVRRIPLLLLLHCDLHGVLLDLFVQLRCGLPVVIQFQRICQTSSRLGGKAPLSGHICHMQAFAMSLQEEQP